MDGDGADRFGAFVNALAGVVGHADRVRPLRDYCMGLLTPAERKSVEPLAAVTAPSRVSAQHQSLLHFVAQSAWSDARVLAKVLELTLPSIPPGSRSRPGSSTTRAFQRRASTRWASLGSTRGSSASRTTAKSRCPCRSRTPARASRLRIGSTCRRTGPLIRPAGKRRACPTLGLCAAVRDVGSKEWA